MTAGAFGGFAFYVNDSTVRTLSSLKYSGSVRYTEHKRHLLTPRVEFTGLDAEKCSFEIYLSASLGTSPMAALEQLRSYARSATPAPLVMGGSLFGYGQWVIESWSIKSKAFDGYGNLSHATVTVSLLEYV